MSAKVKLSDNEIENRSFSFQKKCPGEKVTENTSTSFIVYWSCLSLLLQRCLTCGASAVIIKKIVYGSALFIELLCSKDHYIVWRSQPIIRGFNHGNIKMAVALSVVEIHSLICGSIFRRSV